MNHLELEDMNNQEKHKELPEDRKVILMKIAKLYQRVHNWRSRNTGKASPSELNVAGHVLKELEKELVKHGSSMKKVLKVNVYLADLADYHKMNDVYHGRFGDNPPVRTTVATYGGVPGDSLVEIDCIAAL